MQIETLKIEDLKPYKKNARTHPPKQIELLAKNIATFGFTTPVLIDKENSVIAGHGRILAMKQLQKDSVPCVRMEHLTPEQVKALRFADNQIASMSDWDMSLAIEELTELDLGGFDIGLTGFDKKLLENDSFAEKFEVQKLHEIIVECQNETEQEKIYTELTNNGYVCRVSTL